MAKRKDTSKSLSARNRSASKAQSVSRPTKPANKSAAIPSFADLEDGIEEERARLMQAHSILSCVSIAMDVEDVSPAQGPHYPTLIEKACDLINESISRLDAVHLGRVKKSQKDVLDDDYEFEAAVDRGRGGKNEVRDPAAAYEYERRTLGSEFVPSRTVN